MTCYALWLFVERKWCSVGNKSFGVFDINNEVKRCDCLKLSDGKGDGLDCFPMALFVGVSFSEEVV